MQFAKLKLRIMSLVLLALVMFFVPQSVAWGIPDTPDVRAITSVLRRYYTLLDTPITELDITLFSEVLLDTEDFELTDQRKAYLSRAEKLVQSQYIGYLTAMQTKYAQLQHLEKQRNTLLQKAQSENRQATDADWEELTKANNGQAVPYIYHKGVEYNTEMLFKSVVIEGDKATVHYDDEAALQEAILKYVDGKWFIVDVRPIWIHF